MLGYFEFFYRIDDADVGFDPEFPTPPSEYARIRAKNAVNLIALETAGHGQTPTEWQLSTYPDWARSRITLLREGVNLADRVETRCVAKTIPIWPIEMDERYRVIFQIAPESCCDSRGAAPFVAFVPQGTSRASQSGTTFTTNINASNGTRLSTRLML